MSQHAFASLLIPAVGGQGGGVLSEWIVDAALEARLLAHGTSIPGVAQRTGATSYYVEIAEGPAEPAFSLYPVPGAVDVLLAPELLEVGRAIELGMVSPERTTVIASTHRLYSIHEKIATGAAIYPAEQVEAGARAASRRLIAFDALAVAREHGTETNAVLLGALAGSGTLPVPEHAFRSAIERKGVQVASNLRGFEVGLEMARRPPASVAPAARRPAPVPEGLETDLAGFPAALRPVLDEAVARLVDYQDRRYARDYLERLRPFVAPGADRVVAEVVARYLAVWMTYEDAIRVADLKTRRSRFERIRREAGVAGGEVVITDYLKPDLDELYGLLPHAVGGPIARWAERRWPHGRPTVGQHVRTTTVLGFLRVWLLGRCRWLRPHSLRARVEQARIGQWLDAVRRTASRDAELGAEVARLAQLVKGYGDVRRRLVALFDDLLGTVVAVAEAEPRGPAGATAARRFARAARLLALRGPEGETEARALAAGARAAGAPGEIEAILPPIAAG